jgi:hypothetical protein
MTVYTAGTQRVCARTSDALPGAPADPVVRPTTAEPPLQLVGWRQSRSSANRDPVTDVPSDGVVPLESNLTMKGDSVMPKPPEKSQRRDHGTCCRCGRRTKLDVTQLCKGCAPPGPYTQLPLPGFEAADH